MEQFLLVFYGLFFATGFMGGAALLFLEMRVRSAILRPLLLFQCLFLVGTGLIVVYFYAAAQPGGMLPAVESTLLIVVTLISASIWWMIFIVIRRMATPNLRRDTVRLVAGILALMILSKMIVSAGIIAFDAAGRRLFSQEFLTGPWSLSGMILAGVAMAAFGFAALRKLPRSEPPALRSLMRAYGICAIVFAPGGLIEYAVAQAHIGSLTYISIDHIFYFAWNIISMSAAIRVFRPVEGGAPIIDVVPSERIKALGLSSREAEIAVQISRGLANKEIATELGISPATVRTHIYNLYQKVGARSRVELLNKLRS
jgi:DNA-binding CsgD family transcriptional regulator